MRTALLRTIGLLLIGAGVALACGGSSDDASGGGTNGADGGPGDGAAGPAAPTPCNVSADCPSLVCNIDAHLCAAASCNDGVKNPNESDVDCGGACGTCDTDKACTQPTDCRDGVCAGGKCAAPTNTDGVKNGNETGVDCGSTGNPRCADGQGCATRDDCANLYCKNAVCTPVQPGDGVLDGNETDLDCGGEGNAPCADGKKCLVDDDCVSSVCKDTGGGLLCQVPTPHDGKKNGDETDTDCGGSSGAACAIGKSCLVGGDCTSGGCSYLKQCANGRSCTGHYGGDTCGLGGAGGQGAAQWESCCTTSDLAVTLSSATATEKAGVTHLDKYQVTAGRMRAFLEAVGYNVRGFVQQARADGKIPKIFTTTAAAQITHSLLEPEWDAYLPTSFDGSADAGEIADCDQGSWDYTNKVCCLTVKPTTGTTCPANTTYDASSAAGDQKCHYWDTSAKTCRGNNTGVYPGTYTAVKRHLGGVIFRANSETQTGCFPGSPGTHSFRFPDGVYDFDDPANAPQQTQDVYDTKAMNCTPYLMAQAFCIWDGGRLASLNEWRTASYGTGGTTLALGTHSESDPAADQNPPAGATAYNPPWWAVTPLDPKHQDTNTYFGNRFPTATDATLRVDMPTSANGTVKYYPDTAHTIEYADWEYSYEYPSIVSDAAALDYIVFISAPGRTKGRGWKGHADVLGNVFEIESNLTYNNATTTTLGDGSVEKSVFQSRTTWSGNGSWEVHDYGGGGGTYPLLNKYGKQGFRCAHK